MKRMIRTALVLLAAVLCLAACHACAETAESVQWEGLIFPADAEAIDLGETQVRDFNAFADMLAKLPKLKKVDMFATQVTKNEIELLAARFPEMDWGWTMVIRCSDGNHQIRTDQTSFSTLHNNKSPHHKSEDFTILKYCRHLFALDVGHNSVTSLDFLEDLPELRVLIVACNEVTDITPVAKLKNLEYAELFKNKITDITPVTGLTSLLDLNICFNKIQDITPVLSMTWLKRLWMFAAQVYNQGYSAETTRAIRQALPATEVDTTHYSTTGTWRYLDSKETRKHPHYAAIVASFGDTHLRPKKAYYPFEDSHPFTAEELAAITAAQAAFGE